MTNTITSPHDKFFKDAMGKLSVAREFLTLYLPEDMLSQLDLNSITPYKEHYLTQELKLSVVDVLYQIQWKYQPGFLYTLIEHQSTACRPMPLRIWHYTSSILSSWFNQKENNKAFLPPLYPIVFYTGKKRYHYPRQIIDLFSAPRDWLEKTFALSQHIRWVFLTEVTPRSYQDKVWVGLLHFFMQHIHAKDILSFAPQAARLVKQVIEAGGRDYAEAALTYWIDAIKISDIKAFQTIINHELGEEQTMGTIAQHYIEKGRKELMEELKIGTYAQHYIEKGREEAKEYWLKRLRQGIERGREQGIEQGIEQVALKLLQRGISAEAVAELTGLSHHRLFGLQSTLK